MKLEVGMYVRFYNGDFGKVANYEYREEYVNGHIIHLENDDIGLCCEEKDFKASNNIIDLIEVGDIITYEFPTGLGMLKYENVTVLEDLLNILKSSNEYKILSIITHEQIESMQYKVD